MEKERWKYHAQINALDAVFYISKNVKIAVDAVSFW